MKRIAPMGCAVVLMVSAFALAQTDFINTQTFDYKPILTTAPSPDAPETKKEIEEILKLQASRTPAEVERIKSEVKMNPFLFSNTLGPWFNPDDLPVTTKFLKKVFTEASAIADASKDYYVRKRPPLVDSRIEPCIKCPTTYSFPSGHSTEATVLSLVLAEMFPDQRDALIERGRQIGDDRVLAGVHFPSDVEAGRLLGLAIAKEMIANPDFQDEMAQAKAECDAVMAKTH